jgi:hypothetical protein
VLAATLLGLGCFTGFEAGGDAIGGVGFATGATVSAASGCFSSFGCTAAWRLG